MESLRRYVVDSALPGCLPDRAEPSAEITSEEDALAAFRDEVSVAAAEALTNGEITAEEHVDITEKLSEVTVDNLLALPIGGEVAVQIVGRSYYLMCTIGFPAESRRITKEKLHKRLVAAIKEADIERAQKIMAEIDSLPIDNARTDAKVADLIALIKYGRKQYRYPDLSEFARGERNGLINSILMVAGVPYAVVGQMRPSPEWQNVHETVRYMILHNDLGYEMCANWLVDLPKGEAAPEEQDDFAGQIREEPKGKHNDPNKAHPWFNPKGN